MIALYSKFFLTCCLHHIIPNVPIDFINKKNNDQKVRPCGMLNIFVQSAFLKLFRVLLAEVPYELELEFHCRNSVFL